MSDNQSHTAQSLDTFNFAYSLIPHGREITDEWRAARGFDNPLYGMQVDFHDGRLASSARLISSENNAFELTSVRATSEDNELLVRGYSRGKAEEDVTLTVGVPVAEVAEIRLNGDLLQSIPISDPNQVRFTVGPSQIKTFLLRFDQA